MSKVFPSLSTSSIDIVHGGEVKKYVTPSRELLVTWESEQYSNMACWFGYEDNRLDLIEQDNRLFLGFSDAAPNVVLSPDPHPMKRLYFVLFDPRSRNYCCTAGDVFSNTRWPEQNELGNLNDAGGHVFDYVDNKQKMINNTKYVHTTATTKSIKKRIKLGVIYTHSTLADSSIKDQQQKLFFQSLHIRCNLHFSGWYGWFYYYNINIEETKIYSN